MEDCNMLVADCIVVCCCSQCLILQIIIFVLLKLPCKLIRKTKEYAKKKLGLGRGPGRGRGRGRKEGKMMIERVDKEGVQLQTISSMTTSNSSLDIELIQDGFSGAGFQCCIQEVEKVLEELSHKGEFAFGSLWGRSDSQTSGIVSSSPLSSSSSCLLANERFDFVHYYELVNIASFISATSLHHLMAVRDRKVQNPRVSWHGRRSDN